MPLTASFTDVRRDFTTITDKVMNDRVSITVFKHNKPAFKIIPFETSSMQDAYLNADLEISNEYHDVFEELAK